MKYALKQLEVKRKNSMSKKPIKTKFHFYVDCEDAWTCLENGKPIDSLYPDHFKSETRDSQYHDYMKTILLPGEEYVLLDGEFYDYALTSFGRVVNCIFGTQFGTYFKKNDVALFMRSGRIHLSKIFEEQGWKFDILELINNHHLYKWNYSCVSGMQHHRKKYEKMEQYNK